ncbi:MAG: AsmA family protein [Alphaproteobacteria bacterium]|nr:AsmA family protein [Alphaproteobacteria bacterium]
MKKLAAVLAGLIVVAIVAILIGPSFMDWNSYKPEITAAVEARTGRKLTIDGAIDLRILPSPQLSVANVRLSNAKGAADAEMIRLDAMQVHVALAPLLVGAVQISSVTLVRPVISLERFADGSVNWELPGGVDGDAGSRDADARLEGGAGGVDVRLDGAKIIDGSVIFRDVGVTKPHRIEDLDATIVASSLDGPFSAKGGLTYQGLKTSFEANIGRIGSGRVAAAKLQLDLPGAGGAFSFEGTVDTKAGPSLSGKLIITTKNLRETLDAVAPALDSDAKWPSMLAKPLELTADISGGLARIDVADLIVQLGEARLRGAVMADLADLVSIDAKLVLGRLDLDKFGIFENQDPGAAASSTKGTSAGSDDSEAPSFKLPRNMRAKLSISADGLDHGGSTIRQIRVEGSLDQGTVAVDVLTAQLPGGTNVTVTGTLYADAGLPRFFGRADVVSDNLRTALNWLKVPLDGLVADRFRKGVFSANIDASPKQVDLTNWTFDIDNTSIDGGLTLLLRERPAFGLSLVVDKINLDAYLSASKLVGVTNPATVDADDGHADAGTDLAKLLSSFDANLLIKIGEVRYRDTVISETTLDATVQSGELVIRDRSVNDVGGAVIKVTGELAGTVVEPSTDINVSVSAKSAAKLARLVGIDVTPTIQNLGGFNFQSKILGSLASLNLDAVLRVAGARLDAKGVVRPLDSPPRLDLALKFSHPKVEQFIALFDKDTVAQGLKFGSATAAASIVSRDGPGVDLDATLNLAGGRLTVLGLIKPMAMEPEINARVTLDHPDIVKLISMAAPKFKPSRSEIGPLSLKFAVVGNSKVLSLNALSLRTGPTAFTGDVAVNLVGARPNFSVRLETSDLELNPWLAATTPKTKRAVVAVPVKVRGREWSRDRVDLRALGAFDAELDLSAKKVTYGSYIVDGAGLKAKLVGGRLTLSQFGGGLFGGRIAGSGRLETIDTPAAEMVLKVENADIRAVALAVSNKGQVSGILDYETQLSTRGASEFDMISSLQGNGKIRIHDGSIDGMDLPAVSEQLKKLDGALDFLKLAQRAMKGGTTPIDELRATYSVTDGVLRSDDIALSSKVVAGRTNVIVNLPSQEMDARSRFWLSDHPNSPPIGVHHTGPLDNPRTILDVERMQAYVLRRVVQRGVLRQFRSVVTPKVAPSAPVTEAEGEQQSNPLPSLDKLKPRDALKSILKGLLN